MPYNTCASVPDVRNFAGSRISVPAGLMLVLESHKIIILLMYLNYLACPGCLLYR